VLIPADFNKASTKVASSSQEEAKVLIYELKDFDKNYVPERIKDIVPKDYQQGIYENIATRVTFEIIKDKKFSEKERKALDFLKTLDSEVIKWYVFEKGFDENTVEYPSISRLQSQILR